MTSNWACIFELVMIDDNHLTTSGVRANLSCCHCLMRQRSCPKTPCLSTFGALVEFCCMYWWWTWWWSQRSNLSLLPVVYLKSLAASLVLSPPGTSIGRHAHRDWANPWSTLSSKIWSYSLKKEIKLSSPFYLLFVLLSSKCWCHSMALDYFY